MKINKNLKLLIGGCILFLILLTAIYGPRYRLQKSVMTTLSINGFEQLTPPHIHREKAHYLLRDTALDKDGFNKIGVINLELSPLTALLSPDNAHITIDDLILIGEWSPRDKLSLAGWNGTLPSYPPFKALTLNSGRLDLMTPYGAIRLNAKGQFIKDPSDQPDHFEGAIWGKQHQLNLDTRWRGTTKPDGSADIEVTLKEARIHTEKLQASRVNGWGTIARTKHDIPTLSGQIEAGQINLAGLSLSDVNITLDGPSNAYHFILKGEETTHHGRVTLYAEFERTTTDYIINITAQSNELAALTSFLEQVKNSLEDTSGLLGSFTSLMLTPGNIQRISEKIERTSYDSIALKINGPLQDMSAKIITQAQHGEAIEQNVISLNPSE